MSGGAHATFQLEQPGKSTATLCITMTIDDWKDLLAQMGSTEPHKHNSWPSWKVKGMIQDLIGHAISTFSERVESE